MKQRVIQHADRKILLCDHSKFLKTGTYIYADFSDFNTMITNPLQPKELDIVKNVKEVIQVGE